MNRNIVRYASVAAGLLVVAGAASGTLWAQDPAAAFDRNSPVVGILKEVLEVMVFSALGLLVLLIAFKALDLATPFSMNKEIAEDDNTAAGVVVAGMMIAMGLIIHGALTSRF